jgi:hypothetical protein
MLFAPEQLTPGAVGHSARQEENRHGVAAAPVRALIGRDQ